MFKIGELTITNSELQDIVNKSTSIRDVLRNIRVSLSATNHTMLSNYLTANDIDMTSLVGRKIKRHDNKGERKKKLSEILIENGSGNSSYIKRRLLIAGVKPWRCEKCGNSEYDGDVIPLELHHVNGNHYDNRIENLIFLCPICHARTTNYRGKKAQYDREISAIAKKNSIDVMDKLLEKERLEETIYKLRKMERGEIPLHSRDNNKPKRYCKYCGNLIKRSGAKYFCSQECAHASTRKNVYDPSTLLEESKQMHSMIEFSKKYGISDSGMRKVLKEYGIIDECKRNFIKR